MDLLSLPHKAPIRFVKHVINKDSNRARVALEFPFIPSLGMLIEAAAQSSAALGGNDVVMGFLVSLKGIKLLNKPTGTLMEVEIINEYSLGNMSIMSFNVFEDKREISRGSLTIAIG